MIFYTSFLVEDLDFILMCFFGNTVMDSKPSHDVQIKTKIIYSLKIREVQ